MFGPSLKKIEKWGQKGNIAKLQKVLSGTNIEFRNAAFKALGENGSHDAVTLLTNYVRHPDAECRKMAAVAMGETREERTLEFLRKMSKDDENEEVREAASEAIKKVNAALARAE